MPVYAAALLLAAATVATDAIDAHSPAAAPGVGYAGFGGLCVAVPFWASHRGSGSPVSARLASLAVRHTLLGGATPPHLQHNTTASAVRTALRHVPTAPCPWLNPQRQDSSSSSPKSSTHASHGGSQILAYASPVGSERGVAPPPPLLFLDSAEDPSYLHVCPPEHEMSAEELEGLSGPATLQGGHQRMHHRGVVFDIAVPVELVESGATVALLFGGARDGNATGETGGGRQHRHQETFRNAAAASAAGGVSVSLAGLRGTLERWVSGGRGERRGGGFRPPLRSGGVLQGSGTEAQADDPLLDITHTTLQTSGPVETQNNVVFISAGYLKSQQGRFDSDCKEAVEFMKIPKRASEGFEKSVAFARYASVLNVFSVFQPSIEEGATHPASSTVVNNNLECTYGSPLDGNPERMLACDMEKVSALATSAPCGAFGKSNVVVVTLVNAEHYGGAGMYHRRGESVYRQASFFNRYLKYTDPVTGAESGGSSDDKKDFASLFFHEVGHAYANLFDEYSFGSPSRGDLATTPNCAASASTTPWQGWISEASTDPYRAVNPQPVPVCGYTDFFKPSDNCIMERLKASRLCPICREATVLAFYEDGMDITNPRCPQEGEITVLEPGEHVYLYVNKRLEALGGFNVVWSYGGKALPTPDAPTSLKVGACAALPAPGVACAGGVEEHLGLGEGEHVFDLEVRDMTDWVLPPNRIDAMVSRTTFTVSVVAAGQRAGFNNATKRDCHTGGLETLFLPGLDGGGHHSYCLAGSNKTCEISYKSSAYEQSQDLSEFSDAVESLVFGIVGASVGGLLLLFLLIWCCLARENAKRAKCIFKEDRPGYLECVRWTMIATSVLCMLGAAAAITVGMLYYRKLGAIGKLLVFGGLGFGVILFIIAFVGFTAAWYRSKCALTVNGILLVKCFLISLAWTIFAIIFHETMDTADSWAQSWMEDLWVWLAQNHDQMLCSLENVLECSGYFTTCQRLQSEKYCPENCESTHAKAWAAQACEPLIKGKFDDQFVIIVVLSVLLTLAMLLGVIFNFVLRRSIGRFQRKVESNFTRRASFRNRRFSTTPAANASHQSFLLAKATNADALLALIGSLSLEERQQLKLEFQRVDRDGDGTLNRREFRFFIKTALLYKASPGEVEALFQIVDKDNTGKISLTEFIDMLGLESESPQAQQHPQSLYSAGSLQPQSQWAEATDPQGLPYYYHVQTRETTRDLWAKEMDTSGRPILRNRLTGDVQPTPGPAAGASPPAMPFALSPAVSPTTASLLGASAQNPLAGRRGGATPLSTSLLSPPAGAASGMLLGQPTPVGAPPGWVEVQMADSPEKYWWNRATGETSYTDPRGAGSAVGAGVVGVSAGPTGQTTAALLGRSPPAVPSKPPTPALRALSPATSVGGGARAPDAAHGWTKLLDPQGQPYWWHRATGETTYTMPALGGGGGGGAPVSAVNIGVLEGSGGGGGAGVQQWLTSQTPPPRGVEDASLRQGEGGSNAGDALRAELALFEGEQGQQQQQQQQPMSQTYTHYSPTPVSRPRRSTRPPQMAPPNRNRTPVSPVMSPVI